MPAKVHLLLNQKGGVGKTTLALNLAAVTHRVLVASAYLANALDLAAAGAESDRSPVLVVSTDPQESARWWSERVDRERGVPFDFAEAKTIAEVRRLKTLPYAHIFVDTPGSLVEADKVSEELLLCDDVLVPVTPDPLGFEPTKVTIDTIRSARPSPPYRVVINNWDPRDGTKDLADTAKLLLKLGWPTCNTIMRRFRLHARAAAEGKVVTQYPRNRTAVEAAQDFYALALELGYGGGMSIETAMSMREEG